MRCLILLSVFVSASLDANWVQVPLRPGEVDTEIGREISQEVKGAQERAQHALVPEALVVVEETKKAIEALDREQCVEAASTLERAITRLDVLASRYPDKPMLPIEYTVELVDVAPLETKEIKEIIHSAEKAMRDRRYPEGRSLLNLLRSELNIYTMSLPLVTYPAALKRAATLISQQSVVDARNVLMQTLRTLVIANQTFSLSIMHARVLLSKALETCIEDKKFALTLVHRAWHELDRARDLGYIGRVEEYFIMQSAMKDLEKQIESNKTSSSTFSAVKEKILQFFKRQAEGIKHMFQRD